MRGWDDPRLPTLVGLKRKGYTPTAINNFCDAVGVTTNTVVFIDFTVLGMTLDCNIFLIGKEHHCRQEMEARCPRAMAVLDPLEVEITNYPADKVEMISRPNHPMDASRGTNTVPFTRTIYIERSDFRDSDVEVRFIVLQ